MCSGALRAAGDSVTPFRILVICGFVNVAADALFLIVIPMGVAGVAAATAVAQYLSALLVTVALQRQNTGLFLRASELRMDGKILYEVLRIGLPTGIQTILITVSNVMVQYYINAFGATDVAAFATYYKLENLIYLPLMAFGQASTTFSGQNTGAMKFARLRRGCNAMLLMCIAVTAAVSGLILLFPDTVFGWFMKDAQVVERAILIASVSFPFYWFYAFLEVYGGALRGMGHSICPMAIIIANICVLRIILLAVFSRVFGTLASIAAVYPISWGTAAICCIIAYIIVMRMHGSGRGGAYNE